MPDGDVYELNVDQTYTGQNITNVHHFQQVGTDGGGAPLVGLTEIWKDNFQAAFDALVVTGVLTVQLRARQLTPVQTQTFIAAIGNNGDILDKGLPPQQCAILHQQGERRGRKGTGHMKISGVPIANVDAGRINVAYATLMNTLGEEFKHVHSDVATGYSFEAVVFSQIDSVASDILAIGAGSRIRTVYSRSIGVGQ